MFHQMTMPKIVSAAAFPQSSSKLRVNFEPINEIVDPLAAYNSGCLSRSRASRQRSIVQYHLISFRKLT